MSLKIYTAHLRCDLLVKWDDHPRLTIDAEYLGIDEPDFDDFDETRNFIDENRDDYWREMRENGDI